MKKQDMSSYCGKWDGKCDGGTKCQKTNTPIFEECIGCVCRLCVHGKCDNSQGE
jgi:hypothetical protein